MLIPPDFVSFLCNLPMVGRYKIKQGFRVSLALSLFSVQFFALSFYHYSRIAFYSPGVITASVNTFYELKKLSCHSLQKLVYLGHGGTGTCPRNMVNMKCEYTLDRIRNHQAWFLKVWAIIRVIFPSAGSWTCSLILSVTYWLINIWCGYVKNLYN